MCIPSYVELGAGIVTSCLPTLPKFFKTIARIPCVSKMWKSLSYFFKSSRSSNSSKRVSERSSSSSWAQHRRKRSISRVERGVSETYDILDEWGSHNAAFSTISLGTTTVATGMRDLGNNLEMKPADEERGILRSVQISVVRQGSSSSEGCHI